MSYLITSIPQQISIGNQLESGVTSITFDISAWTALYPSIVCSLTMVAPAGGEPFPLSGVSQDGDTLTWLVNNDATENDGTASVVVHGSEGNVEKRSAMFFAIIQHGHEASGEAPAEIQDWATEAALAEDARAAAESTRAEFYDGFDDRLTALEGNEDWGIIS